MALKRRNKVGVSFGRASMDGIAFLLLLLFMVTSTQLAPRALKLLLPKSNNHTVAKANTTAPITGGLKFPVNKNGDLKRLAFSEIEPTFLKSIQSNEETYFALRANKAVPNEQPVNVINIAKHHQVKMTLATSPEVQ